jgi:hypothetical protein
LGGTPYGVTGTGMLANRADKIIRKFFSHIFISEISADAASLQGKYFLQ